MADWREKIKKNDIQAACRLAGLKSTQVYYNNKDLPEDQWTDSFIEVMLNMKKIVEERESKLKELQGQTD